VVDNVLERHGWSVSARLAGLLLFAAEVLALCLPALVNRGPLVYPDTRAYYLGGRAALDKVASLFQRHADAGGEAVENTLQKARGVRSAFYSLFTYITGDTVSLWLVILLQAAIIALVLRLMFAALCPGQSRWRGSLFIMVLAMASTVAWTVSMVMPDVFTAVMAICIILVMLFWQTLSVWTRVATLIAMTGSVVMHPTNLPIGLGLLAVGAVVRYKRFWPDRGAYLLIGGALGVAALAMLAVGVVGFHRWTLTPQSPPFLLARSLSDGPGKLYLQEHCPQAGLVMCRHLDKLDLPTDIFIWDKDGVYSAVSPDEEAQLRAEDKRVYLAAALEHPVMQLTAMVRNMVRQLGLFSLHEYSIPSSADYTPTDMTLHLGDQRPWQTWLSIPVYVVVIAALVAGMLAWRNKDLDREQRDLFILVVATVLIEAAAGAFSEPVPRYEARVIWLIPMASLLFAFNEHGRFR